MSREGLKGGKGQPTPSLGKRERVLRALAKQEVDKRPFTFWHPFGLAHMKAESLSASALTFAATYGVDLLRLPTVRDFPLPAQTSLDRHLDLANIEPVSGRAGFWGERLEALKSTVRLAEKKIAIFEPISDPLTTLGSMAAPDLMASCERVHRGFIDKALGTVTESLKSYLKLVIEEAKVDGIVVEIGSASFEGREPGDFESLVKPHLRNLLEEIRSLSDVGIWLQVTGKRIYLEPLLDLPHDLLSWSHLSQGPSLEKLPRGYRGVVAGGLNEVALEQMSYQDIRRHVDEARNLAVGLLCPGDMLSAEMSPTRLQALANFMWKRDRLPEPATAGRRFVTAADPIIDEP